MSTRISGLLLSVRNCHASVKIETELTLLLYQWSEGRQSVATFRRNQFALSNAETARSLVK